MPGIVEQFLENASNVELRHSLTQSLVSEAKLETQVDVLEQEVARLRAELEASQRKVQRANNHIIKLTKENRRLDVLAHTDGLTNLDNRHGLRRSFEEMQGKSTDNIVMILDIDFFKRVNDKYDHAGGDKVLKEFARLIHDAILKQVKSGLRHGDKILLHKRKVNKEKRAAIGRWGGEEFVIVVEIHSPKDALTIANRLRKKVESTTIEFEGQEIKITSSCGFCLQGDKGLDEAIKVADKYLYMSKETGRNRVIGSTKDAENPDIFARRVNKEPHYPVRRSHHIRHFDR